MSLPALGSAAPVEFLLNLRPLSESFSTSVDGRQALPARGCHCVRGEAAVVLVVRTPTERLAPEPSLLGLDNPHRKGGSGRSPDAVVGASLTSDAPAGLMRGLIDWGAHGNTVCRGDASAAR